MCIRDSSQTDATLSVGESVGLSATHEPADASVTDVVWCSSNEAVATVSQDGTVTAVGAGAVSYTHLDVYKRQTGRSLSVWAARASPTVSCEGEFPA